MNWITRFNIKIDRVASPWLIRWFIDPNTEFLFAPEQQLLEASDQSGSTPFDALRIREIKLNHRDNRCW